MKSQFLDTTGVSIENIWLLYQALDSKDFYSRKLTLQLLHALFPCLDTVKPDSSDVTEAFFRELCKLVNGTNNQCTNFSTYLPQTTAHLINMNPSYDLLCQVGSDVNGGLSSECKRLDLEKKIPETVSEELATLNEKTAALGKIAEIIILDGMY